MNDDILDLLKEMREEQNRKFNEQKENLDLVLESSRKQEEVIAEMKKTINEKNFEISLLQKQQSLSLKAIEECEKSMRSMVPSVEHLTNRVQEIFETICPTFEHAWPAKFLEMTSEVKSAVEKIDSIRAEFGNVKENLKMEIVSPLAKAIQNTTNRVDEINPLLATFSKGQTDLNKRFASLVNVVEELKKEQSETRGKTENQSIHFNSKIDSLRNFHELKAREIASKVESSNRKMSDLEEKISAFSEIQGRILETVAKIDDEQLKMENLVNEFGKKWEQIKTDEAVLSRLHDWMTFDISLKNGKVTTKDGRTFSFNKFNDAMKTTPWLVFPEEYEVECHHCKKQISVSSNLRDDKTSVQCPHCKPEENKYYTTMLGAPKQGFEWVRCRPCEHYQQVPNGERPKNCGFCGKKASKCEGPYGYRTPTRK